MTPLPGAAGLLLFLLAMSGSPAPGAARGTLDATAARAPHAADSAAPAAAIPPPTIDLPADSLETPRDRHGDLLLFEAETWIREKNWPEAIRLLRQVVAVNPNRVDAWEALAGACRMALSTAPAASDSLVAEALDAYRAILERQPRNRRALEGTLALAGRFRAPAEATAGANTTGAPAATDAGTLEAALRRNPADVRALAALARLDLAAGNAERAEQRLRIAFELGDSSRATGALLLQLEDSLGTAQPAAERAFYRGRLLLARGDNSGAERAFHQALEMDSTGAGYDTWLGIVLHRLRRDEDALGHLQRALENDPDDPAAHYHAGIILYDLEQYEAAARQLAPVADEHLYRGEAARLLGLALSHLDDAEEESAFYLERAIREGAADPLIPCLLGEQYIRLSRWKEARASFRKCVAARPDFPTVLLGLGLTADHDGDYREAVERLEAFRADRPVTPGVLMRLGLAYLKLDEPDSAAARFREAIAGDSTLTRLHAGTLDTRQLLEVTFLILMAGQNTDDGITVGEYLVGLAPTDAGYANNLAMAYADAGKNLDRALELALVAGGKEPDSPVYLDTLGWTYLKLKRYREARENLERALELERVVEQPDLSEIYYHLGALYAATKEREKAVQCLKKSLEYPVIPQVELAVKRLLYDLQGEPDEVPATR